MNSKALLLLNDFCASQIMLFPAALVLTLPKAMGFSVGLVFHMYGFGWVLFGGLGFLLGFFCWLGWSLGFVLSLGVKIKEKDLWLCISTTLPSHSATPSNTCLPALLAKPTGRSPSLFTAQTEAATL